MLNLLQALSFNLHLGSDTGEPNENEDEIASKDAMRDYIRVPVIQKLVEADMGSSNDSDRMVPHCNTYNGYHQADSPDFSSSDELIVV